MVDKTFLQKIMRKQGLSAHSVAARIGLSDSLFSMKLNGLSPFTINQAHAIKEILDLSDDLLLNIFFSDDGAKRNKMKGTKRK